MIARLVVAVVASVVLLACADPATAQLSRFAVSGGYQITSPADQTLPIGWSADIASRLNTKWSIVGEVSGAHRVEEDQELGVDARLSIHSFGAGVRWSHRVGTRVLPFLQVLAGATRMRARAEILDTRIGDSSTDFMVQPGGGVDLRVTETLGLVGQADYRRVAVDDDPNEGSGENQFRAFVGVRFGL